MSESYEVLRAQFDAIEQASESIWRQRAKQQFDLAGKLRLRISVLETQVEAAGLAAESGARDTARLDNFEAYLCSSRCGNGVAFQPFTIYGPPRVESIELFDLGGHDHSAAPPIGAGGTLRAALDDLATEALP